MASQGDAWPPRRRPKGRALQDGSRRCLRSRTSPCARAWPVPDLLFRQVRPDQRHRHHHCGDPGLAGGDRQITFKDTVGPEQVLGVMQRYDALAVPSKWLETGPLVVLEAIEAGVHVLGANLGGIAELVDNGITGTLLPPFDIAAWTAAIEQLAHQQ